MATSSFSTPRPPSVPNLCPSLNSTGFLPNGQVFDSTEKKGGKPLAFKLGSKQVIVGLEQVVSQMLPGEEVQALIPSDLAYGEKGVCTEGGECLIDPNTNLKVRWELRGYAVAILAVLCTQSASKPRPTPK